MRLFTGIDLPDNIKERLDVLIAHLRTTAHIKWSPAYNLHITLKFIGEWPAERLPEMVKTLAEVPPADKIELGIRGLGWLPNERGPRIFYASVNATPSLENLARAMDRATAKLGVRLEERAYHPHLTLARIKQPAPLDGLRQAIASLKSQDFGSFVPKSYHLYLSETGPSGSIYTRMHEFTLPIA